MFRSRLPIHDDRLPTAQLGYAEYHYYIASDEPLSSADKQLIQQLLPDCVELDDAHPTPAFWVSPRIGTLSPWSTKATDIAQVSGLAHITRIERVMAYYLVQPDAELMASCYDRMTESLILKRDDLFPTLASSNAAPLTQIDVLNRGAVALMEVNQQYGLALSEADIVYLMTHFEHMTHNPSLAELMMFAQVNSEHCRHKIFNAAWTIDGKPQPLSLFQMIKNTYKKQAKGVLSAYHDNAAVIVGAQGVRFYCDPHDLSYKTTHEPIHSVIKVETHNHPTAISPFAGAATGVGGEIRDEGATGVGAKPKAGLCGYSVSNLAIPGFEQSWETPIGKPGHIASALQIMLAGPIGAASYNNEFGRPNVCGYFRTYTQHDGHSVRGYHKPIMIAGGLGCIREHQVDKGTLAPGQKLLVIGGPAMLIGLGGGAASSVAAGSSDQDLDFASVQRANPEMQRRCQQLIDACWALGEENPIVSIHDVGAGGLSNALPELAHDSDCGGRVELRAIPVAEAGLSPMAIWCSEAQERYVLGVDPARLSLFSDLALRERCPIAVLGEATLKKAFVLHDEVFGNHPVDLPMDFLFSNTPQLQRKAKTAVVRKLPFDTEKIDLKEALQKVLCLPVVASKKFLITIGDRSVGGLVVRDQMVGPWQVPVADCAVTAADFSGFRGEAMAMGERAPIALLDARASARMAIGEAITNIAAAHVTQLSDIKLSANWMAACGTEQTDAELFSAVHTTGMELCPELGICIPVGKDSLSMRMHWQENDESKEVISPLSLVISAFAPVADIRHSLTPQLIDDVATDVLLIDLSQGHARLGGSALAQVYQQLGDEAPDANGTVLKAFFRAMQQLREEQLIAAYHDRSDGGLWACLCEMAFAGRVGLDIRADVFVDVLRDLCHEELGVVIQIKVTDRERVMEILTDNALAAATTLIAKLNADKEIRLIKNSEFLYSERLVDLQQCWSKTSFEMQKLRDDKACAEQEFQQLSVDAPAIFSALSFDLSLCASQPQTMINVGSKPKVAILREQGVNGHVEMAMAFYRAGFEAIDVHMSDVIAGRVSLQDFSGLAACGGFSYGDVLGAGRGWAAAILHNARARDEFTRFFQRQDTFCLGVCNGCQMLSQLRTLIPGTDHWPVFAKNQSQQFEARLVMVEIEPSNSLFFQGMVGSTLPVVVSHGEGQLLHPTPVTKAQLVHQSGDSASLKRALELANQQANSELASRLLAENRVTCRYVDQSGHPTTVYPLNPNGSAEGITGVTSEDGRVAIMMPHPERVFRGSQFSWCPPEWQDASPWQLLFNNARTWLS